MRWPAQGELRATHEKPWRANWRYRACALVLSSAWALCLGFAAGCIIAGLPHWRLPAAVAAAGILARVLLEVEARHQHAAVGSDPQSSVDTL